MKQLGALRLLETFRARGVTIATPRSVYGEMVAMSLSEWLSAAAVARLPVSIAERKTVRNACDTRRIPGASDCDAIALAAREGGPLLTHDDDCAMGARAMEVTVVDVCDVADFLVSFGWTAVDDVITLVDRMVAFAYKPVDWAGDVRTTVEARPRRDQLLERLRAWSNTA